MVVGFMGSGEVVMGWTVPSTGRGSEIRCAAAGFSQHQLYGSGVSGLLYLFL